MRAGTLKLPFKIPPLDWPLAWAALGLIVMGLLTVYSATSIPGEHEGLWLKQVLWAVVAVGAAYVAAALPLTAFDTAAPVMLKKMPAYAHSLSCGNRGTITAMAPMTFQNPMIMMKYTG